MLFHMRIDFQLKRRDDYLCVTCLGHTPLYTSSIIREIAFSMEINFFQKAPFMDVVFLW